MGLGRRLGRCLDSRHMLRSRWPLPFSLALAMAGCTGAPPDTDGSSQPPPPVDADEPEPTTIDPKAEADTGGAVAEPAPVDPWGPITEEQRAVLLAGDEEERITTPEHYVQTNEWRHDVWFPYLADKRGIYLGVAADQNYTLAAVAKSEFMLLMDLDWRVTELHRAYEVLIEASEDAKTLHERFHEDNADASAKLIEDALRGKVDDGRLKQIVTSWRGARETVYRHLAKVITRTHEGAASSWLSNPEYYAHIRKLYQNDRIRMLVGNLTGPQTLTTVAAVAEGLGLPITVVYLSNAEEYYDYTTQYRKNIKALPTNENTILLRTIYSKEWVHADTLWNYQVQPLADYKVRMDDPKLTRRTRMLAAVDKEGVLEKDAGGVKGLSRINIKLLPGFGAEVAQ
jgi:hypothetical protein